MIYLQISDNTKIAGHGNGAGNATMCPISGAGKVQLMEISPGLNFHEPENSEPGKFRTRKFANVSQ